MRAATRRAFGHRSIRVVSIHAAREGSDAALGKQSFSDMAFQSTLPVRAATTTTATQTSQDAVFQSTLPVRAATGIVDDAWIEGKVSIHAAREGSDSVRGTLGHRLGVSIHAAREGSDNDKAGTAHLYDTFQSTLPVRAATYVDVDSIEGWDVSIHAAREGSDLLGVKGLVLDVVSIHAAREGSDVGDASR